MTYKFAIENRDFSKIDKLNKLVNKETFWNDVMKLTKKVKNDHAIKRWQSLTDQRYTEILTGYEDVRTVVRYGKITRYFDKNENEVFINR